MSTNEVLRLFLRVCDDLQQKEQSNDEYEILKSSGLLRQLLLDELPLIHQINRTYRLKVKFVITDAAPPSDPSLIFWNVADGLDPNTSIRARSTREVDLEEFLKTVILRFKAIDYTVRDVILFEAHVRGGVHAGTTRTEKEEDLKRIDEMARVGGFPPCLRELKAISRVVLRAVQPLRVATLHDASK